MRGNKVDPKAKAQSDTFFARMVRPARRLIPSLQIQRVRWRHLQQHTTAAPPAAAALANSTKVPVAAVPVSTVAHSNSLPMYTLLPTHARPQLQVALGALCQVGGELPSTAE